MKNTLIKIGIGIILLLMAAAVLCAIAGCEESPTVPTSELSRGHAVSYKDTTDGGPIIPPPPPPEMYPNGDAGSGKDRKVDIADDGAQL